MALVRNVLFLLMVAVSASVAPRHVTGGVCSELKQQDGLFALTTLSARLFECTAPLFAAVARANSTRDHTMQAVDEFCNELEHRACVANLTHTAKRCLNTRNYVEFRVNQHNLHMILAEMCLRQGVRAAVLFQGVVNHRFSGGVYPLWQVCYLNLEHLISGGNNHTGGGSIAKYKFLKHFRACVVTLGADQTNLVDAATDLLNKIIEKFKCVHPLNRKREVYCYVLARDHMLHHFLEI